MSLSILCVRLSENAVMARRDTANGHADLRRSRPRRARGPRSRRAHRKKRQVDRPDAPAVMLEDPLERRGPVDVSDSRIAAGSKSFGTITFCSSAPSMIGSIVR